MTSHLDDVVKRAFTYGFPLVFDLEQVRRYVTTGVGANPAAPFNTLSHARSLAGPEDRFVSINNDTVYSFAQLDLSGGPLLLEVPDTGGRYYVMQFVSAWTENFAYLGKRATGTQASRYLIVGPRWDGRRPPELADVSVIRSPTEVASLVGRWSVDGPEDLADVHRLQDATTLGPVYGDAVPAGLPEARTDGADEALAFFEKYRRYSQAFPPPARDRALQGEFAALGLTGRTPVFDLREPIRAALASGYTEALEDMQTLLRGSTAGSTSVNGWSAALHAFDYNLDHFEIGTVDDPRWKLTDPCGRLVVRACAAMGGLWGCHAYEAAYFSAYVDDAGTPLSGVNSYELTLSPPPPNGAFWSLTMYDVPDYHLVPNALHRFSIGDRTEGLVTGADGSVTITISATEPTDPERRRNWLPAPVTAFRPLLRVYLPESSVLSDKYSLPPIRRIG